MKKRIWFAALGLIFGLQTKAGSVCPSHQAEVAHCLWKGWPDDKPCYVPMCKLAQSEFLEHVVCKASDQQLTLMSRSDREAWSGLSVSQFKEGVELVFRTDVGFEPDDLKKQYPSYQELRIMPIGGDGLNSHFDRFFLGARFRTLPTDFHCDINE